MNDMKTFPVEIELRIFNHLLHTDQRKSAACFLRLSKAHHERYAFRCWHTVHITRSTSAKLLPLILAEEGLVRYRGMIERIVLGTMPTGQTWTSVGYNESNDTSAVNLPSLKALVITRACFSGRILYGLVNQPDNQSWSKMGRLPQTATLIGNLLHPDLDVCIDVEQSICREVFPRVLPRYSLFSR
jgi:hypothetical protein